MRNVVSWKPLVLGASFLLYGAGTAFATETDYLYPTSSTGLMSVQQDGRRVIWGQSENPVGMLNLPC